MDILFYDLDGNGYTQKDIYEALLGVGASECDTLFIHSDVFFGKPAQGFKRKEYLDILNDTINNLGVKNIIVPTFTYSFCNNEVYDVVNSKTFMGAYNEFIRKKDKRFRTIDPLLSVSVPNELKPLFDNISNHSLGPGSALDIIHNMNNVKFLFFGAEMSECFTYVHYVEKMLDVPYRFDLTFKGKIILPNGEQIEREQTIHTQCKGAILPSKYTYFEREMEQSGKLKKIRVADKYIACISEKDSFLEIKKHINSNINYFLMEPLDVSKLEKKYTYDLTKGRITHC